MFAIFWRARSRVYRNQLLQLTVHFAAFLKFYTICTLFHFSNILAKHQLKKISDFLEILALFCLRIWKNLQTFVKFPNSRWIILSISTSASKRVFTYNDRCRYSRKREKRCQDLDKKLATTLPDSAGALLPRLVPSHDFITVGGMQAMRFLVWEKWPYGAPTDWKRGASSWPVAKLMLLLKVIAENFERFPMLFGENVRFT